MPYNTGNAVGSVDPRDLIDNAEHLDDAVNGESPTWTDRLGKSRLTWTGIVKAGTGDAGIIVPIVQQAVQDVIDGVDGQVAVAENAADRAEAASDAAFVNADVYPDIATGRAAVGDGEQFQVVVGEEIVRYRRDSSTVATEVSRYPTVNAIQASSARTISEGVELFRSENRFNPLQATEADQVIGLAGTPEAAGNGAYSGLIRVIPGQVYSVVGFTAIARYDSSMTFLVRTNVAAAGATWTAPAGVNFVRLNYNYSQQLARVFREGTDRQWVEPWTNISALRVDGSLIYEGSVTADKTDFIEQSPNLFDPSAAVPGILETGTLNVVPNSDYYTSGFIPVVAGETYAQTGAPGTAYDSFLFIGLYTAIGTPVGRVAWSAATYTMPASVGFIRLSYRGSPEGRMIHVGTEPLAYEPFWLRLRGSAGGGGTPDIPDGSITPVKTSFIVPSKNLFNPETVTPGFSVSSAGEIVANAPYSLSDYIPAKPFTAYSKSGEGFGFVNMSFWDASKTFISRQTFSTGVVTLTTPANTAFLRVDYQGAQGFQRMLAESPTPIPFDPYGKNYLSGVALSEEDMNALTFVEDVPMIDMDIEGVFSTTETYPEHTDFRYTTAAQVYAMYDALMDEYPDYITKQSLGTDDFGNQIAVYKFFPARPVSSYSDTRYPRIFINAGIHGYEHVPGLITFLMLEDMCRKWQDYPLLEAMRFNVDFLVIPVANPSGWDDYTRTNRNGVDLNRNFPDNWVQGTPGTVTYGGPEPFSEPESRYISQVMSENPSIDAFYDFHNFSGAPDWDHFIWVPTCGGRYVQHMAQMLIQRMTRKWRAEYSWIPDTETWFAGYTDSTAGGMTQDHAFFTHGIRLSALFEVCGRWWQQPDAAPYNLEHKQAAVNTLVNWMLINLQEIVRGR